MIHLSICSAGARIVQSTLRIRSRARSIIEPAWMQVYLHVMLASPIRPAMLPSGSSQKTTCSFHKKGRSYSELAECIDQKPESVLVAAAYS